MRDELRPYLGQRERGDPADEAEHFYLCQACQQPVDMRDLAAVFHHEEPGHEPLPAEDAERLLRISEQLARASLEHPVELLKLKDGAKEASSQEGRSIPHEGLENDR